MRQAWHIFKKDLRLLQLETWNYLGAILVAGWLAAFSISVAEILVAFTAAYLIAGLIHADAPAGDRQFWITRPYRWQSLLAAKLFFIFLIIDLPVLIAQWALLIHDGFAFSAVWRGLFWEQFLLLFGVFLPMAALAALTTGVVSFVSFAMVGVLIDIGITSLVHMPQFALRSMGWVRSMFDFLVLVIASAIVVGLQYKGRCTPRSRLIAVGILAPGILACIFVPWSLAFAIQQRFSTQPLDPSSLGITLDSSGTQWGLAPIRGKGVDVSLTLKLQGLAPGTAAKPEALEISFRSADGRDSRVKLSDLSAPTNVADRSGDLLMRDACELDRSFFDAERDRPVTLRGLLYFTVFGNKREHTIYRHWPDQPVSLTEQLRCYIGPYGMSCNSPFRWPDEWIGMSGTWSALSLYYPNSHSPFPADLRFYPFDNRWAPPPVRRRDWETEPVPDVTVEVEDPVAFVRREFEIRDVHLTDVAIPWRSEQVSRDGKTFLEKEY